MQKILSTQQIKALDAYTIRHEPIDSIDLMERACRAFVGWLSPRIDTSKKIGIICGTGNNGGDGLGIARMLHAWNYNVKVWVVRGTVPETEDFKINFRRIDGKLPVTEIVSEAVSSLFADCDVLIDAIFGSGLSRPVDGIYAQVIDAVNQSDVVRIAVDIPSGLVADGPSHGHIVRADYTVSFQLPKLAFLLPQSHLYVGEWTTVDIGLHKGAIKTAETENFYVTLKGVKKILKPRAKFSHKGSYGHALLVAGSYGKMGAAVLASRAALRSGPGLLTVHIPREGYAIIQTAVPEAMTEIDPHEKHFSTLPKSDVYAVVGIGPGLGQHADTVKAFRNLLESFRKPIVIDADGLNILAVNPEWLQLIPENSILTPHPKEFERLAGVWSNDFEKLQKQRQLARDLKSVIVLKGANTSIAAPDGKMYFNATGNPGMATGGTGDVLTGIVTGLVAQSYSSTDAAVLGVYLHGLSGDLVAMERGMYGMVASDLVDFLPSAFTKLTR
ncbi:MAG: NAD(P)H-hydrate dehydratase [Bacteroidota bacterium]